MRRSLSVLLMILLSLVALAEFVPYTDVDTALRIAQIEKKDPIFMFSSNSCYYCQKFKREVLTNKTVEDLLHANFVFIEIQYNRMKKTHVFGEELDYGQLFQLFKVRGTPTFWFLTAEGSPITYLPGYTPPEVFSKVLRYMARKLYKQNVEFSKYVKQEDDYVGKPQIVKVKREDAEFVLENDPLAIKIATMPSEVDPFKVYVTSDETLAGKLLESGVYRVLVEED